MSDTTRTVPIDAWVVAIDKTHCYAIDDEDKPLIKRIYCVYLFDRNEVTYCCEITPSHYLMYLYDCIICDDGVSDEDRERLDSKYTQAGGDNIYVHCFVVNAILSKPGLAHHVPDGDKVVTYEEVSYDEQIEAIREHYTANWMVPGIGA